jgi:hypothetical protein
VRGGNDGQQQGNGALQPAGQSLLQVNHLAVARCASGAHDHLQAERPIILFHHFPIAVPLNTLHGVQFTVQRLAHRLVQHRSAQRLDGKDAQRHGYRDEQQDGTDHAALKDPRPCLLSRNGAEAKLRIPMNSSTCSSHAIHLSERSDASVTIIPSSGRHGQGRIDLAP